MYQLGLVVRERVVLGIVKVHPALCAANVSLNTKHAASASEVGRGTDYHIHLGNLLLERHTLQEVLHTRLNRCLRVLVQRWCSVYDMCNSSSERDELGGEHPDDEPARKAARGPAPAGLPTSFRSLLFILLRHARGCTDA